MSEKSKRRPISIETKLEILRRIENGEKAKQLCLEFNIDKSIITRIKKKKEKIESFVSKNSSFINKKTVQFGLFTEIEDQLVAWIQSELNNGSIIKNWQIQAKAIEFHKQMGYDTPFKASDGWLGKFKARNGISINSNNETTLKLMLSKYREEFKQLNLMIENIYIYSDEDYRDVFDDDNLIITCVNLTGSHKLCLSRKNMPTKLKKEAKNINITNGNIDNNNNNNNNNNINNANSSNDGNVDNDEINKINSIIYNTINDDNSTNTFNGTLSNVNDHNDSILTNITIDSNITDINNSSFININNKDNNTNNNDNSINDNNDSISNNSKAKTKEIEESKEELIKEWVEKEFIKQTSNKIEDNSKILIIVKSKLKIRKRQKLIYYNSNILLFYLPVNIDNESDINSVLKQNFKLRLADNNNNLKKEELLNECWNELSNESLLKSLNGLYVIINDFTNNSNKLNSIDVEDFDITGISIDSELLNGINGIDNSFNEMSNVVTSNNNIVNEVMINNNKEVENAIGSITHPLSEVVPNNGNKRPLDEVTINDNNKRILDEAAVGNDNEQPLSETVINGNNNKEMIINSINTIIEWAKGKNLKKESLTMLNNLLEEAEMNNGELEN
ncbi:hypothetical protein K502DRAFT_364438, partial [Neoconidiobolus thromboides FSU 785]